MSERPSDAAESERLDAIAEAAIDAIGEHVPANDYRLDLEAHAAALPDAASGLKSILLEAPSVREAAASYRELDQKANHARSRFEFWVFILGLFGVSVALGTVFLVLVPLEFPPTTDWRVFGRAIPVPPLVMLSLAAVIAILAAFACDATSKYLNFGSLKRQPPFCYSKTVWACWKWLLRAVIFAAAAFAVLAYVLPQDLRPYEAMLMLVAVVAIGVLLLVADGVSGGAIARLFGRRRSLKEAWYQSRGRAEKERRAIFTAVLAAAKEKAAALGADSPVLSQALEFVRRYHIQVQQSYFADASKRNKAGADRAEVFRSRVFLMLVVLAAATAILFFGTVSEQAGAAYLPESASSLLLVVIQNGWDDILLLLTLTVLGIYVVLQLRTAMLGERRNGIRFGNALAQLRYLSSPEPGKYNREVPSPLRNARRAAAAGDAEAVERFVGDVNRMLALETGEWNHDVMHEITDTDAGPRLTAAHKFTEAEDFEHLARDLEEFKMKPFAARKISYVAAREATTAEPVETRYNGKETHNVAQPGDWIATNMDAGKNIIRDVQGNENTYVIPGDRFTELYGHDEGTTEFGDIYKAKGVVDAIELPGGFDIMAPWGERQQAAAGYIVRNGRDIYGIHKDAFDQTYEEVGGTGN